MRYRLTQIKLIWMYFKVFQTDVQSPLPLIFKFVHALDKGKLKEIYRRFKKTKVASKVLNSQDHFLDIIEDGDFEPGTFGAEFKAWSRRDAVLDVFSVYYPSEKITPLSQFLRSSVMEHDLIHFFNGYDTSPYGEIGVLSFHLAKEWRESYASILYSSAIMAFRNSFIPAKYPPVSWWKNILYNPFTVFILTVREGWRRGKRAPWFMSVDWEAYLNVDLQLVKKELNLQEPPKFWMRMSPMWAVVREQYIDYANQWKEKDSSTSTTDGF